MPCAQSSSIYKRVCVIQHLASYLSVVNHSSMQYQHLLREHIKQRLGVQQPANLEMVLEHFQQRGLKKGEVLLPYGAVCKHVFFVASGALQVQYIGENGQAWTRDFIMPTFWCCSMESFVKSEPGAEEIICVQDAVVLGIEKSRYDWLLQNIPEFGKVYQQILTEIYVATNRRMQLLLTQSAAERIHWLYAEKMDLVRLFSAKKLASYLHLNKDVFCRLRPEVLKAVKSS